ncbi:glycosyltransferase family 9 protein [Mariniflexile gromovii]|uniref:Glycosyltransferase family 9 protein n=1 Tax=Mariniflexile gromovii TaxID=362523 RepID=A0ABS4BV62_9FLAO|nr:glycosyltransferase family 9 protein [Mariniflexile gromovii]MBP0903896.1 glycosyltransferase family 9 protein [Mariniflexile gromovii]
MKILVIQQKMIGDVLTSSILFKVIKDEIPNAELHYLINTHTFSVVDNNPFIDKFIYFTKEAESSKKELFKLAKSIRKEKFDVVIDVYSKLSSNIITLFSGAKTKISYHKFYTTSIYTHNVKRHKTASTKAGLAIENRLLLLEPLGIKIATAQPKIYLKEEEITNAKTFLEKNNIHLNKPIYMVSVLGSGLRKTYPFEYMAEVIDTIANQTKGSILFNYIPNQLTEAETVFNLCKPETKKHIKFDVFGKSLREFLAITSHCTAVIGNEGGAINMAKALNINTFAIFSPWIDTATWGTFESNHHINVHLKDYKPELYANKAEKEMKNESLELYKIFKPAFFTDKLKTFLN